VAVAGETSTKAHHRRAIWESGSGASCLHSLRRWCVVTSLSACSLLQIDLIDMSKEPDGLFKYILNYQDIGASASAHGVWSTPLCDMLVAMVQRRSLFG